MIFSAYFTENYPLQLPPKFGVKNSMVQKPTKSFENERLIPKRLPRSDFDAWQKLPPAATRKAGGNTNRGRKTHQIYIE